MQQPGRDLWERCLAGEAQALAELRLACDRAVQQVGGNAGFSLTELEDAAGDFFLFLIEEDRRRLRNYRPENSFNGWLYWQARGFISHRQRRMVRHQKSEVSFEADPAVVAELKAPDDTLAQALAGVEGTTFYNRVAHALAALPPAERTSFLLHSVDGLTFPQIGAAQGIRPKTAQKRSERARDRLRRILDRCSHQEPPAADV
jgi:RNA polymerase sigma factor (sigma-70 family)